MQGYETAKNTVHALRGKLNLTQKSNNFPDNLLIPTSLKVFLKIIFVDTFNFYRGQTARRRKIQILLVQKTDNSQFSLSLVQEREEARR